MSMSGSVVIVDADQGFTESARRALEAQGLTVHVRTDAPITILRKLKPAVLLVAVELPRGSTGFSICSRVRRDREIGTVPILLTSREASEEAIERHARTEDHADDYARKPLAMPDLVARIGRLLGQRPAQQPHQQPGRPDQQPGRRRASTAEAARGGAQATPESATTEDIQDRGPDPASIHSWKMDDAPDRGGADRSGAELYGLDGAGPDDLPSVVRIPEENETDQSPWGANATPTHQIDLKPVEVEPAPATPRGGSAAPPELPRSPGTSRPPSRDPPRNAGSTSTRDLSRPSRGAGSTGTRDLTRGTSPASTRNLPKGPASAGPREVPKGTGQAGSSDLPSGPPASGPPASGPPASGPPASGTPASGTPASGTPASGTPSGTRDLPKPPPLAGAGGPPPLRREAAPKSGGADEGSAGWKNMRFEEIVKVISDAPEPQAPAKATPEERLQYLRQLVKHYEARDKVVREAWNKVQQQGQELGRRVGGLQLEVQDREQRLEEARQEREALARRLETVETEFKNFQDEITKIFRDKDGEEQETRARLAGLEADNERLRHDLKEARDRNADDEHRLKIFQEEVDELQTEAEDSGSQIAALTQALGDTQGVAEALRARLTTVEDVARSRAEEIESLRESLDELAIDSARKQEALEEDHRQTLAAQLAEQEDALEQLAAQHRDEMATEVARQGALLEKLTAAHDSEIEALERRLKEEEGKVRDAREELERLETRIRDAAAEHEAELAQLRSDIVQLDDERARLAARLRTEESNARMLAAEREEIAQQLEVASADQETLQDQVRMLEADRSELDGRVEALESELAAERSHGRQRSRAFESDLEAARSDAARLQAELEHLQRSHEKLSQRCQTQEWTIKSSEKALAAAETRWRSMDAELGRARAELDGLRSGLEAEIAEKKAEIDAFRVEIDAFRVELDATNRVLAETASREGAAQSRIVALERELEANAEEAEAGRAIQAHIGEFEARANHAEARRAEAEARANRLDALLRKLARALAAGRTVLNEPVERSESGLVLELRQFLEEPARQPSERGRRSLIAPALTRPEEAHLTDPPGAAGAGHAAGAGAGPGKNPARPHRPAEVSVTIRQGDAERSLLPTEMEAAVNPVSRLGSSQTPAVDRIERPTTPDTRLTGARADTGGDEDVFQAMVAELQAVSVEIEPAQATLRRAFDDTFANEVTTDDAGTLPGANRAQPPVVKVERPERAERAERPERAERQRRRGRDPLQGLPTPLPPRSSAPKPPADEDREEDDDRHITEVVKLDQLK